MAREDWFEDFAWLETLDREDRERLRARLAFHRKGLERLRAVARDEEPLFPGESEAK